MVNYGLLLLLLHMSGFGKLNINTQLVRISELSSVYNNDIYITYLVKKQLNM